MNIGLLILMCLPFFLLQLLLLKNTKKTALRMIPLYIVLLEIIVAVLIYLGVFGTSPGIAAHQLLGILMIFSAFAFVGAILLGWVVYWLWGMMKK